MPTTHKKNNNEIVIWFNITSHLESNKTTLPPKTNSLCNLPVVFAVLSANINGHLTHLSALLKISLLKIHSWRDNKTVYMQHFAYDSEFAVFLQVGRLCCTNSNQLQGHIGKILNYPFTCFIFGVGGWYVFQHLTKLTCLIRHVGHVGGIMFDCFFIMFQRCFKVLILICKIPQFFFLQGLLKTMIDIIHYIYTYI